MAVLKVIVAGLLALAGMGVIAFAVMEVPRVVRTAGPTLVATSLRPFPALEGGVGMAASVDTGEEEPAPMRPIERDAGVKVAAPVPVALDAGVAKGAVDAGVKSAAPAVAAAPPAPKDAGVRAPPAAPVGDATMSLQASDTADVYVDGRKIGSSPIQAFKVKAGTHKVRFDCYDEAGNAVTGTVRAVTLAADEEQEVTYTCNTGQ